MKVTNRSLLIAFGVFALGLMACLPLTMLAMPLFRDSQSEQDSADEFATLQAVVTQTLQAVTQVAPSATPIPATATPVPATATSQPANTAVSYCDWVTFIQDVTIPDGTRLNAGENFTKTWRLQNRGTCTWNSSYQLVYVSGDKMGDITSVSLDGPVYPGQTVDLSVRLTVPSAGGRHTAYWMLRNPAGRLFGAGAKADEAFFVEILTEALPHGTVTGTFRYPSEFNPPLVLYFENASTHEIIQFSIPENNLTYSVLLPNGKYYAYAWAYGYNLQGAYVNTDLTMKTLTISGGQTTANIDIGDWGPNPHSYGQ